MKVLLSIKPEYVEKILDGTKKFEFRKGIFKNPDVKSVVIYSTMPVGMIVAEFDIADVIEDKPSTVWKKPVVTLALANSFLIRIFTVKRKPLL
jgi:predicted transcriptional regulator